MFLDSIFTAFLTFLGVYALFGVVFDSVLALGLSIMIAVAVGYIFGYVYFKRLKKRHFSNEQTARMQDLFFTLPRLTEREKAEYMQRVIYEVDSTAQKTKLGFYSSTRKVHYYYLFTVKEVGVDEIITLANKSKGAVVFYLLNAQPDLERYFSREERLTFYIGGQFFKLVDNLNVYPELQKSTLKPKLSELASNLLKAQNAKKYTFFGLFFITFSFIVPLRLYYAICGMIFLALAIAIKFNKVGQKAEVK